MLWHRSIVRSPLHYASLHGSRTLASTGHHALKPVPVLPSWGLADFRKLALDPALPAQLPFFPNNLPPASQKWFFHDVSSGHPTSSELNYPFWQQHQDTTVPLELTQSLPDGTKTFQRSDGPLRLFLEHSTSSKPALADNTSRLAASLTSSSLYIAQCSLSDLPPSLQADLPAPELVLKAGRGDIYDSSLWMGRPPTFTPLHKDPNPNLFVQLAGQKVIRLFSPEVGGLIFDAVQMKLGGAGNATFRGEEMMQGREREELEEVVWGGARDGLSIWQTEGLEARLSMGEALFIPKGWWHSVRGVGAGMNASANWWFR